MTAVWPRGLPAASTTYHLRTILPLFAIKVDMAVFSFLVLPSITKEQEGDSCCLVIEGSLVFLLEIRYNDPQRTDIFIAHPNPLVNSIFIYLI